MAKEEKKKAEENIENQDLDWDDGLSVEEEGYEFEVLPVGEYEFEVVDFEKTFSKSDKKMAKITLEIVYNGMKFKVWDYLVLTQNMAWKIASFFEALGLKKKGTELKQMPWNQIMEKTGRVKIKHEEYNGQTSAKVDRYIPSIASEADDSPLPFEV